MHNETNDSAIGLSTNLVEVPGPLREIMASNAKALAESVTKKSSCLSSAEPCAGSGSDRTHAG